MKLNRRLTKEILNTLEEQIRSGETTRQAAADIVGVTGPVMCRWVTDGRPLWDRYTKLREYSSREPLATRTVQTPEWGLQTYAYCAKKLQVSVPSFAKRLHKHGPDNPRTWIVGKLVENNLKEYQDKLEMKSNWGNLKGRPRDHNLSRIPEPTKYERRMYGKDSSWV